MKNHPFYTYIQNYTPLSLADWQKIAPYLKRREYKKGDVLLKEGMVCQHVYFLESGVLRYFIWKDGQDISKFFTLPPYCFTSQRSFTTETPTTENIEVLEDAVVWVMHRRDAYALFELKAWNTFVRKLVQEVQFFTEQILEDIQNETAENRYIKMVQTGDILLQKVPLKHLASYLGIAPQSLSRIRKKIQQANQVYKRS